LLVLTGFCRAIFIVYALDPGANQQKAENDCEFWQSMLDKDQNSSFLSPPSALSAKNRHTAG
jgi:hypothetical protein